MTQAPARSLRDSPGALLIAAVTTLAYVAASALTGLVALAMGGLSGIALPLYPSAGIALVAVMMYGRAALPGVFAGALLFNLALMATTGRPSLPLPLVFVAIGATLNAMLGAALIRRFVSQPVVLNAPRDILAFALAGAGVGCLVSASISTAALVLFGAITREAAASNWWTWWVGDALGVLIAAPLVLTLIGRPRADWRERRVTLGIPLLGALVLLAAGTSEYTSLDQRRLAATFERDADRMTAEAQARLAAPLHALQALKSVAQARGGLDREALAQASRWWLQQYPQLQAMGYSARVAVDDLPAFELAARAEGQKDFRVFDRDGGRARAADQEVVALRQIEPRLGNEAAIGVNTLSIPAAREAVLATRDTGRPAASAGFELTQSSGHQTGIVLYQALQRGEPADEAARRQAFLGVVFVTVRLDRALEALASPSQQFLRWCLIDADPRVERRRLAGAANCESLLADNSTLKTRRSLDLAGRPVDLLIAAQPLAGVERGVAWLLSLAGVAAAALLGALLLTVTGHARRTELAVQEATAALRRQIAERTQAQDALRESEARLRSILDHVPLGVMFLDPDGQVIDGNPRMAEMAGRSVEALRGTNVLDMVHPEEVARLQGLRRELLAGTTLDSLRLRAGPWALAGELQVRVSTRALRDPGGRVLRLVAVLEDITEHLQLQESERALHRAEAANRAKSEFLSRMSHELRTPLNAIIGFAQLLGLDRKPELLGHQREWTQQIQRAGWHLLDLINETLDLARIESGAVHLSLEPVAVGPLVAACQSMVLAAAAQRGVRMTVVIDADACAVVADPTRLKQVVTNLLSNAVKYNRDGGSVTLRSWRVTAEPTAAGTSSTPVPDIRGRAPDMVEISVEDSGLGMTPEQLDDLFQPYNRLGRENSGIEGTGIGLVISRRLSELMDGTLRATSVAGHGSIFTLRLPAATATAMTVAPDADTAVPPYHRRRVHYVEDNEINVEVMRGVFAQRPQILLEVSTLGLDGLTAIRANRPDLILLDMQLPDISGLELLRHLKRDDLVADIPVIVVSADATTLHMERALTSGALHYVTKPLEVSNFLALVDGVLENVETRWSL